MTAARGVATACAVAAFLGPASALEQARPLSIVLLVDVTASVSEAMASFVWDGHGSPDDLNLVGFKPPDSPRDLFLKPIEDGFIRHLHPTDRVRVGVVTTGARLEPEFTTDPAVLAQAVRKMLDVPEGERYGPTPLWDGVDVAITALEADTARRTVILITDGLSTGNRLGLAAVIDRARRADVAVSVVAEAWRLRSPAGFVMGRDSPDAPFKLMRRAFGGPTHGLVERLALETGGQFVLDGAGQGRSVPALARVLEQVLTALR
jgi:hypothetical protein